MKLGSDYIQKHRTYDFNEDFPVGTTVEHDTLGTCVIHKPAVYALFPHQNMVEVELPRDLLREEMDEFANHWTFPMNKRLAHVKVLSLTQ